MISKITYIKHRGNGGHWILVPPRVLKIMKWEVCDQIEMDIPVTAPDSLLLTKREPK